MRKKNPAAVALGRRGGLRGGPARMAKMSVKERSAFGRAAARKRWAPFWKITTPDEAAEAEAAHWRNASAEERFLAVEVIREASQTLFEGDGWKFPPLERVYRFVEAPTG